MHHLGIQANPYRRRGRGRASSFSFHARIFWHFAVLMGPKYAHGLEFSKGNPRPCRNHPNFCTLFPKVCKKFLCTHGFSHSKWDPHKNQTGAMVCHPTLNLVQIPIYLAGATIAHILYYTSGIPFLTAVAMTTRRKKPSQDDTTSSVVMGDAYCCHFYPFMLVYCWFCRHFHAFRTCFIMVLFWFLPSCVCKDGRDNKMWAPN